MNQPEQALSLFNDNTKLVHFVLSKYFTREQFDEDLAQEGYIGLWKACLTYNGEVGLFSTYAVKCIMNDILYSKRKAKRDILCFSLDAPLSTSESVKPSEDTDLTLCGVLKADPLVIFVDGPDLKKGDSEYAKLMACGLSGVEISRVLGVSHTTACKHIKRIKSILKDHIITIGE